MEELLYFIYIWWYCFRVGVFMFSLMGEFCIARNISVLLFLGLVVMLGCLSIGSYWLFSLYLLFYLLLGIEELLWLLMLCVGYIFSFVWLYIVFFNGAKKMLEIMRILMFCSWFVPLYQEGLKSLENGVWDYWKVMCVNFIKLP